MASKAEIVLSARDETRIAFASVKKNILDLDTGAARLGLSLGALGGALSVGGFAAFVKSSIDAADHLNDLSKQTGVTVENLSGLQLAAAQSGTDLDSLAGAFGKMSVNISKNSKEFEALGITARDPLEAFKQIADKFNAIQDPMLRAEFASKAFGKAWQELAPLLAEGGKNIGEAVKRGQELSGITTELAEQSDLLNDKFEELKLASTGFGVALAKDAIPGVIELTTEMEAAYKQGGLLYSLLIGMGKVGDLALFGSDETQRAERIQELVRQIAYQTKQLNEASPSSNQGVLDNLRAKIAASKKEMQELVTLQSAPFNKKNNTPSPAPFNPDLEGKPKTKTAKSTGKSEAEQAAEDTAKLIKEFQNATRPSQELSEKLQEQLDAYRNLDSGVQAYLQSIIATTRAKELATKSEQDWNEQARLNMESDERQLELEEQQAAEEQARMERMQQQAQTLREMIDPSLELLNIQAEYQELLDEGLISLEEYTAAVEKSTEDLSKATSKQKDVAKELGLTFKSAFEDAVVGGKKFSEVLDGIGQDIERMIIRKTVTEPLNDLFDSLIGSVDFGALFSANGNAFNADGVMPFAKGGVVSRATPFLFGNGGRLGVMGEAGPEAILPLRRGANGQLGVQSNGMGGANITVNIIGAASQPEVRQRNDGSGNMSVDVIFDAVKGALTKDIRSEGSFAQALQGQYGLNRAAGAR